MIVGNLLYSTCDVEPEGSEGSSMILVNCACTSSRPWSNDKSWDGNNLETSKASKRKAAGDSRNLESLLESSNPPLILLFFVFFFQCWVDVFYFCFQSVFHGFSWVFHILHMTWIRLRGPQKMKNIFTIDSPHGGFSKGKIKNHPTPDLHRAPLTALRLRLQHWRHPQGWERLLCQGDGPGNTLGMGQVTYGITGISIWLGEYTSIKHLLGNIHPAIPSIKLGYRLGAMGLWLVAMWVSCFTKT